MSNGTVDYCEPWLVQGKFWFICFDTWRRILSRDWQPRKKNERKSPFFASHLLLWSTVMLAIIVLWVWRHKVNDSEKGREVIIVNSILPISGIHWYLHRLLKQEPLAGKVGCTPDQSSWKKKENSGDRVKSSLFPSIVGSFEAPRSSASKRA